MSDTLWGGGEAGRESIRGPVGLLSRLFLFDVEMIKRELKASGDELMVG